MSINLGSSGATNQLLPSVGYPVPAQRGSWRAGRLVGAFMLILSPMLGWAQGLTIGVSRTSLSLPLFVAEARRFFADEGVAVQTRECIGGQRCIKLLFDGEVQLATASELPVMFNSFTRADYAIVATFVTSAQDVGQHEQHQLERQRHQHRAQQGGIATWREHAPAFADAGGARMHQS